MKHVWTTACFAAAMAVGLSAQTPSTYPSAQADKGSGNITVTGCVRAGEQPGSFVLADIKPDTEKAGKSTVGTTGTAMALPADITSLELKGSPSGAKLDDHVGHLVQLTGKLSPASAGSAAAGTTGAPKPAAGAMGSEKALRSFDVDSLKMVSTTCSK